MPYSGLYGNRRRFTLPLAFAVTLAATGCGGGGGGGGGNGDGNDNDGGGTTLNETEQAALAATIGGSAVGATQGIAEGTAEDAGNDDSDTASGATVTRSTGAYTTKADQPVPTELGCDSGALRVTENTILDIGNETFPAPFSNSASLEESSGTTDHSHIRANCEGDLISANGSFDVMQLELGNGRAALVYRAGGYTGPNRGDEPDLSGAYVTDSSFGRIAVQGEIHSCNGCVNGDLADFSGTADYDTAAVAFLDIEFDTDEQDFAVTLGESVSDRLTMVTADQGNDSATVDINGRMAYASDSENCAFDVTYDTINPPTIAQYGTGQGNTTNGEMDVTLNDTNETYRVVFDSNGNVTVDGEPVDVSDTADNCSIDEGAGDGSGSGGSGDTDGPDALSGVWRSECIAAGQDSEGDTIYGDVLLAFDTSTNTYTETGVTYDDSACTSQTAQNTAQAKSYEIPGASSAVDGAYEINLRDSLGGDIYEVFRIQDGTLTFGEYPEAGVDSEADRPTSIPADAVEFTQPF